MSVAFNGTETMVLTFKVDTATTGGLVGMSENNTVKTAADGTAPVGIVLNQRSGHAAVQVRGYAELGYSGETAPSLGFQTLVADGTGKLRLAATGETGKQCLIVNCNITDKILGLFL